MADHRSGAAARLCGDAGRYRCADCGVTVGGDELRGQHGAIANYALARLSLSNGGVACTVTPGQQLVDNHTDGAYTVLKFTAACPGKLATLDVGYRLFAELDPQHKGLLRLEHGSLTSTAIFTVPRNVSAAASGEMVSS